jgi:hypothetical protein
MHRIWNQKYLLNKKLKLQENDLKTFEILAREAGLHVTII